MKVLLLKKETSSSTQRESLAALEKRGILPSVYLQEIEQADMEHTETLNYIQDILRKMPYQVTEIYQTDSWPADNFDLIVTIGGDGTILNASHFLADNKVTVVGIRSSRSSVGKLCAFDYQHLEHFTACLKNKAIASIEVKRLKAEITCNRSGNKKTSKAVLNDFLFANSNPAAMTHYIINFADHWEKHKSSGVWISTPAGSSAATLASGGREMDFTSSNFQFRVRELYQSSGNNIIGQEFDLNHQKLVIHSLCDHALLSLDGQHRALPIKYGDTIEFKPALPLTIAKRSVSLAPTQLRQ